LLLLTKKAGEEIVERKEGKRREVKGREVER